MEFWQQRDDIQAAKADDRRHAHEAGRRAVTLGRRLARGDERRKGGARRLI